MAPFCNLLLARTFIMEQTETKNEITGAPRRCIAIVGRPNVGKSTLFNRILKRRIAIVNEESGSTRDRLIADATFNGERFQIMDMAGIGVLDGETARDAVTAGAHRQIEKALDQAGIYILVVDAAQGVLPLDIEVAKRLHRYGKKVIVAANKVDNDSLEKGADDFLRFGYPVFPISAIHNFGIDLLLECALSFLTPETDTAEQETEPIKVAIAGRPNAGKSSFINRMLNDDRVIVSDVPGTTRDSVDIPFTVTSKGKRRNYLLTDTAGMRKSGKFASALDKYSVMRASDSIARADVVVIVLDAVEGPKDQDKKIAAIACEYRKGCVLVVNKWDLAGEVTQKEYLAGLAEHVPFLDYAPVVFVSALTGYNIRQALEGISLVADNIESKLSTSTINKVLQTAQAKYPAPIIQQKRLKIYYGTQVRSNPIIIRLFVNYPERLTDNYKAYLINSLREHLELRGAAVVLSPQAHQQTKEAPPRPNNTKKPVHRRGLTPSKSRRPTKSQKAPVRRRGK